MKTKTKNIEITETMAPAETKSEIVHISPPRLPYHDLVKERFGIDKAEWRVLVDATFPNAKTVDAVIMALSYCKARKLDPFKRPVHIVSMWSSAAGRMIESVWPSIAELRTTAFRTQQYCGMEKPEFGPMIDRKFVGTIGRGPDKGKVIEANLSFPEWCRITILRTLGAKERTFVGPSVYWMESYARQGDTDVPNSMWCKRPVGQLEKCAEAAALRRAFPEEIGNELSAEEMEGQRFEHPSDAARDVTPKTQDDAPPDPAQSSPTTATSVADTTQWLRDLDGAFSGCEDASSLAEVQHSLMMPQKIKVPESAWSEAQAILQQHIVRISGEPPENDDAAVGTILDAG